MHLADKLGGLLNQPITFVDNIVKLPRVKGGWSGENVPKLQLLENLRFWPGEASSDQEFAKLLAGFGDLYVNESFAASAHPSSSITTLPRLLPTYFGYQFVSEVQTVTRVINQPKRPIVLILGGAKPDKLELLPQLLNRVDRVLLGGALPQFVKIKDEKLVLGENTPSGLDLTPPSVAEFARIISTAGTLIWNGPVGKFEEPVNEAGTRAVAEAIVASPAFSLIGGGDTQAALAKFGLEKQVGYLSTGGGSLLTLLATGTLPAIEAARG
jgi:phosphoglycerate kinase